MFNKTRVFSAPISALSKAASNPVTTLTNRAKALVLAASLVLLAGCGTTQGDQPLGSQTPDAQTPPTATIEPLQTEELLAVTDAWAKAAVASDDHAMTGIFGQIHNPTAAPLSIVSASSDVATMVELHETVMDAKGNTIMQAVESGFEIAPGATLALVPGQDHIMLMDLTRDLIAGDQVTFTLTLSNGATQEIHAEIRDYKGAQETYSHEETEPSGEHGGAHGTHSDD